MTRVDLDAIDRILDQPFTVLGTPVVAVDDGTARTLVAELRAAREVVEAAQGMVKAADRAGAWHVYAVPLFTAVAAYDQAVGS